MRLAFTLSAVSLLSITNGYVVKGYATPDCSSEPATYDFPSDGTRNYINDALSVKYQSDLNCVLSTYVFNGENEATNSNQDVCFSPGYVIRGTSCN